jgi:hypothetical protein
MPFLLSIITFGEDYKNKNLQNKNEFICKFFNKIYSSCQGSLLFIVTYFSCKKNKSYKFFLVHENDF